MLFDQAIVEALKAKLDIMQPTSFQSQAIPIILEERDVVAKASHGYGKTVSLCLTALFKAYELRLSASLRKS